MTCLPSIAFSDGRGPIMIKPLPASAGKFPHSDFRGPLLLITQ